MSQQQFLSGDLFCASIWNFFQEHMVPIQHDHQVKLQQYCSKTWVHYDASNYIQWFCKKNAFGFLEKKIKLVGLWNSIIYCYCCHSYNCSYLKEEKNISSRSRWSFIMIQLQLYIRRILLHSTTSLRCYILLIALILLNEIRNKK